MTSKFNKKSLDYKEQIELLKLRGLIIEDESESAEFLKYINYYRLSSYMRHYQIDKDHKFKDGTCFSDITNLYCFDRDLKALTFKYIKRIEIALRAAVSHHMTTSYGSHWFYDDANYIDPLKKIALVFLIKGAIEHNGRYKDTFIKYYYEKYHEPDLPPFWMVVETLSLGDLSKILTMLKDSDGKQISKNFGTQFILLKSWIHALTPVRNISAHHSRLWNRRFKIKPKECKKFKCYHDDYAEESFYAQAIIIYVLMKSIEPSNTFEKELQDLFKSYEINSNKMGFPQEWIGFSL